MQRSLCLIIGFIMATAAPLAAYAAGNVLLPSTSSSSSSSTSLPNLGLSAPTPAPSQTAPTPAPAPPPVQTTAAPQTTPPPAIATQMPKLPATPAPLKASDIISPIDPVTAAQLPKGVMPTQVIHQADMSAFLTQVGQSLPNTMTISIGGKSIFGAKDVDAISSKFGLSRAQIPSNCILTVRGLMLTDKGTYILDGPPVPQVSIRYDGKITRYMMTGQALCTVNQLPPGSGFVTQTGNRYSLSLQGINCPAPNRQASQLVITYDGSDKSQCAYQ